MMGEQKKALTAGVALLERSIEYAVGSLRLVTPDALCRGTPCSGWSLQRLLDHLGDSLGSLNEAAASRTVELCPVSAAPWPVLTNPALSLRDEATMVLGAWTALLAGEPVSIGGWHVSSPVVAAVGAIEVAVHGWDVARSCGEQRPIPPALAEELLDLAQVFVTPADRPGRFAARVGVPCTTPAQDRLLAFLGRDPNWRVHL
ncbi:TIGR03086 family protein [Nonomuraea longispora]|uniref:TIGR03086 family protein n=1 Tax=Nonomuraea longispora TaxID=1848320 RepID=A0A4R4NAD1_9ACTN|nr:TIGR03086 family metal-binding protein [Nonomuraea longispora]TDC05144.1 TIGR03086 family protein [Nonomuraea longispora]